MRSIFAEVAKELWSLILWGKSRVRESGWGAPYRPRDGRRLAVIATGSGRRDGAKLVVLALN